MSRTRTGAVLLSLVTALTACGSAEDGPQVEAVDSDEQAADAVEPSASPTPAPSPTGPAAVRTFFDAFEVADAGARRQAAEQATEPGSPARIYGMHYADFARADEESGSLAGVGAAEEVTYVDSDVRLCPLTGEEAACTTFSGFQVDETTGLLTSFSVDGTSISGRLSPPGSSASSMGVQVTSLGAYQRVQGGSLGICVDATNNAEDPAILNHYLSTYQGPDGRQVTSSGSVGPQEITAGGTATICLDYPSSAPGGTVHMEGSLDNTGYDFLDFELPVPTS